MFVEHRPLQNGEQYGSKGTETRTGVWVKLLSPCTGNKKSPVVQNVDGAYR